MALLLINPGAGPVARASERLARLNLLALLRAVGHGFVVERHPEGTQDGEGGRWCWKVSHGKRSVLVHSPGCVRRMLFQTTDNPFPLRFYVDGNSWMWPYAVQMVRAGLGID